MSTTIITTSKNTKRFSVTAAASIIGLALLIPSTACDQPKPKCASGRGDFFARYTVVSGADACAKLKGEKVGLQTYNAIGANQNPDLDHASIAIESNGTGSLVDNATAGGLSDPETAHKPYAQGAFTTPEPVADFCTVPTLSPAVQDLPAVTADDDAGTTDQPATNITYQWSNVKFYVTPAAYGTQFSASVSITTNGDACTYSVQAFAPYVDCSKQSDPNDPKSPLVADEDACKPEATPPAHAVGSGINPDFPVHCDPDLLVCVLNSEGLPVLQ